MTALSQPGDLRALLGIPFTDHQLAAATAPLEPGLVVAGAGSGKTSVMAARVVWLVGTGQLEPDRVLGLTFTNKASAELAHRVRTSLAKAGVRPRPSDDDLGEPVVLTYHAYAGRLVTEHGLRLGIEPRSRLLADATRYQLAARVLRQYRGQLAYLTSPLRMLVGDLVALESELSEHLVTPAALREWDERWISELEGDSAALRGDKGTKTHCDELDKMAVAARRRIELSRVVDDYRAAKQDLDALDFGDQVALGARLAEQLPEVGQAERERAGVVLLDEYQDTSVAQRRMLAGLFGAPAAPGHPVTAVGDPCQAIYGWRGASVSNLDGFGEHFPQRDGSPAARYSLAVNQRSGGRLLELANKVAASLRLRHAVVQLEAPPAKAELGRVVVGLHTTWQDETAWIAEQVTQVHAEGTPYAEIAVLVRARSDFGDLHAALTRAGLPVEVVGLGGLLSLPEVADVVAVLEVLDDPTANAALVRLLTGPRWRLGARDLAQLGRRAKALLEEGLLRTDRDGAGGAPGRGGAEGQDKGAQDEGAGEAGGSDGASASRADDAALARAVAGVDPCDVVSLADALDLPGHDGWSLTGLQRVTALAAELRGLRAGRDEPLLDLVHRVVEVTGLDVELSASPEALAARRRESLAAFLDVAAGFTDLDGESSLSAFLSFLEAAKEHERGLDTASPSSSQAVQLMTAHKAKGLEWDVVVCPDLTRTVFPATGLRGRWTTTASVLPGPLRGDAGDQPDLPGHDKGDLKAYHQACKAHLEREERRLGYVAFTRPRLLLIGSAHWWGPTQKKPRGPSPFLEELADHAASLGAPAQVWVDAPGPEERNPLLDRGERQVWPKPYDEEPFLRRRAAADQVLADLEAFADGTPLGEVDAALRPTERELLDRLDREATLLLEEERLVRRGYREVLLPTALTASQLLRLQADPDGFARELARPVPRRPAAAARRGTRFHAWVEDLFEQRPLLDPYDLPGAEDDGRADDADLMALQEAFLASPYSLRRPHAMEAPFTLPLAGRVIRGRIDAVYRTGETDGPAWEVIDWKTGNESADPLQLAVYRLAWAALVGVAPSQVRAAFLYVRSGELVVHDDLPGLAELELLLRGPQETEPLTLL